MEKDLFDQGFRCQTAGLVDADLSGEDIDFAVFAGHKTLYSPLGIAGVVSSFAIKPQPLLFGGTGVDSANQALPESVPERYEVASPDIAAIAGLNASLKWIEKTGIQNIYEKEQKIISVLLNSFLGMRISKLLTQSMQSRLALFLVYLKDMVVIV